MRLGLSVKIPLRVSVLILIVGTIVTASILLRAYDIFKEDLLLSSENMGRMLSRSLAPAMLHDDTWKAYEIINAPFNIESRKGSLQADHVVVLDANHQVYVSTRPTEYPMLSDPTEVDSELALLVDRISGQNIFSQFTHVSSAFGKLYVVTPIESDNVLLGTVVMNYSSEIFTGRFADFAVRASATMLVIILLMLPLAVFWARRLASPLIALSERMAQVGNRSSDELRYSVEQTGDEIERLGNRFVEMVDELHKKKLLEQQMVSTERLAALGRFTAGIAHEINNPLGGMLNAINTVQKHGQFDERTEKTIRLLERGLLQIRGTVGAILVEASAQDHYLSHQDVEDTRTLVMQNASSRNLKIRLNNGLIDSVPLPSTLVRQALINLLLNAIEAAPDNGRIDCNVIVSGGNLKITVGNEGERISDLALSQLFEPFSSGKKGGRGLGLWVTYQIVEKLGGDIVVNSSPGYTQFTLRVPLTAEDCS